jgi:hypothetical protein
MLLIGIARTVIARLTTPPITKRMAAMSTKPCFNGEAPFNFNHSMLDYRVTSVKSRWPQWKSTVGGRNLD